MLNFIFRYIWLIIPASGYIVWSFYSIKDILANDLDLKENTVLWIFTTLFVISVILFIICCYYFSCWLLSLD